MTNLEAWNCLKVMVDIKESGRLGFAVAKNMRKLSAELVEYDAKRDELIQRYGSPVGEGKFSFSPENAEKFCSEMSEYDGIEFEFEPMKVDEKTFYSGNLTSDQMYALMWMVNE